MRMTLFNKLISYGLATALSFLPQQSLASDKYQENSQQKIIEYKVKKGETLSAISQKLEIPLEDIVTLNDISNINKIRAGQILFYRESSQLEKEGSDDKNPNVFDDYKNIENLIESLEIKYNIPDNLLHLIVLVETNGKEKDRYEPHFKRKYVDNGQFKFSINKIYQNIFLNIKEKYPNLTQDEFKKQLATSVGVAQVMYSTAINLGFNGSIDELRNPEINLEYAAKLVCLQSKYTKFEWKKVLAAYREGSLAKKSLKEKSSKEKITERHIKRGEYYRELSKKE